MSKGNRAPTTGCRFDVWTASASYDQQARMNDFPDKLRLPTLGVAACMKCKQKKTIKGGSMRMVGDGRRAFTCAQCKAAQP